MISKIKDINILCFIFAKCQKKLSKETAYKYILMQLIYIIKQNFKLYLLEKKIKFCNILSQFELISKVFSN